MSARTPPPASGPAGADDRLLREGLRVGRNSLLLGFGEMVGLALGFVTTILVTDRTGDDYGLLIGAQRYVALFMVLVQFGLHPLLVRAFATRREEAGALLGTVLLVRGLLALGLALVVPVAAWSTGYMPDALGLVMAWLLIETLGVFAETYMAMCEGLEKMARSAGIAIARSLATFVAVVSVTYAGGGVEEYVLAYVCARAVQVAVAMIVGHRALPGTRLRFDLARIVPLIRGARWYAAMGFVSALQGSMAVLVLSRIAGPAQTALFGAALNFLDVVMVLPLLLQRALLPAFSRLSESGGAAQVAHHGLRLIPVALFPAAVGMALLSGRIVDLYPSGEFAAAGPVLATIALWLFVVGPGNVAGTFLTGLGRMRALVIANVLGVAIQVGAQAVLVPRYGAVGAAAGTLVAYGVVACLCLALVHAESVRVPWDAWARSLAACTVMGAVVWPLRDAWLPLPVLAGAVVYLGVLFLLWPAGSLERRIAIDGLARWRARRTAIEP